MWVGNQTHPEDWGPGVEKLDPLLIIKADALILEARRFTGSQDVSLHINDALATDGHVSDSQHYLGRAFDGFLHVNGKALSLEIQALCAFRIRWGGLGLYLDWHTPGIHCDTRPLGTAEPTKIWVRKDDQYLQFTLETWKLIKEISNGI